MDLTTVVGLFLGVLVTFGSIVFARGWEGLLTFASWETMLVVVGGTFASVLVSFPFKEIVHAFRTAFTPVKKERDTISEAAQTIISISHEMKNQGWEKIDKQLGAVPDEFLRRGLQMAINATIVTDSGLDEGSIQFAMGAEIDLIRERHKRVLRVFTTMGTFAPAFGIIGTVLGMILMLSSITNVDAVPKYLAIALSAAFIGMCMGYMIFLPLGEKLKRRSELEIIEKEMIVSGVVLINRSAVPKVVEYCMQSYLSEANKVVAST